MSHNIVEVTHQSEPIDLSQGYDTTWLKDKTILITGGASGFGAAFSRHWAAHGANIIVADINTNQGNALVEELRKTSPHSHFINCDVTNWKSQVELFRAAASLSPHGGIDGVVANAGIADPLSRFDETEDLELDDPPEPQFKILDVNLRGVLYTTKLAIFWLQKNPGSMKVPLKSSSLSEERNSRDRHILLIGSVASIAGILPHEYGISKHGVLGLFRSMRLSSFVQGIRVNMLLPYFIDTPIIPVTARLLLAGSNLGKEENVVDAGTRMMADHRINGRSLVIGPKVYINENWELESKDAIEAKPVAIWEAFAHEHEEVDAFTARFVGLLNRIEVARGWIGWITDISRAFMVFFREKLKFGL